MTDTAPSPPDRSLFATSEEYKRAYSRWRDKYDPKRVAYHKEKQRKRLESGKLAVYYYANRDRLLEQKKDYYTENREQIRASHKAYREENIEAFREKDRAYYEANREEVKAKARAYRAANPEKVKAAKEKYSEANKAEIARRNKEWRDRTGYDTGPERTAYREANREEINAREREWNANNKEKISADNKRWREANPERAAELIRQFRENNPEYTKNQYKKHYANNRAGYLQRNRLREARRQQAQPKWLTKEQKQQIDAFYAAADLATRLTGVQHVVDHIAPLKGKNSCGLHVPWNLQVLTALENSRKRNKESSG